MGAFLMGSILSCTDTATVVSLLKENCAPNKFSTLIEGESLLNYATCMILIIISSNIMKGVTVGALDIAIDIFSLSIGGSLIGIIFGFLATFWIKKIYYDSNLIINVTFAFSYIVYYTSNTIEILGFHFSGIISVVFFGYFII
jgi:NhaP-type Na+/H+ or K+/H+ antiporter